MNCLRPGSEGLLDVYCPTHESCISLEGLDAELSGPEQSRAIWKRGCQGVAVGPCSATCTCSPPCSSPCSWAAVRCLAKPPPGIEWVRKLLYKREWADQHLAGHGGQEITKAKLRVWLIDPSFWWMSSGLSRITKRVSVRKFAANSFSFGHTSILCAVSPPLSPSVAIFVYVNTSDVTILPFDGRAAKFCADIVRQIFACDSSDCSPHTMLVWPNTDANTYN